MKHSIFACTTAACVACGSGITEPTRTDNHTLVTDELGTGGTASAGVPGSEFTYPAAPISIVTASNVQEPCVSYCKNYLSCVAEGSLDCESVCATVIEQIEDKACLQPVFSAFDCLRSRICSDGIPDLSAMQPARDGGASAIVRDNCRLEALAVDCRLASDPVLAGLEPNPFEFFASGAGINDCYLADEPAHDTSDIRAVLKTGLTGFWRCPGSSHTYSTPCVDAGDRITCRCEVNGVAYLGLDAPISWPQAADQNYWQYIVERCGWRY